MKRLIFSILLSLLALASFAQNLYVSDRSFPGGDDTTALLKNHNAKLLYYNDSFVLYESPFSLLPYSQQITSPKKGQRLFLLDNLDDSLKAKLTQSEELLYYKEREALICSSKDDVKLRAELKSTGFVQVDRLPLPFPKEQQYGIPLHNSYDDLVQLSSCVSADSVLFFIQTLQDMQTRFALAGNRFQVASWIASTFSRFGIADVEIEEFTWNTSYDARDQYNVVATIPGSEYPDEYIVIGGHYDSITYKTPYELAPGADDNASGVAAALEIARVLCSSGFSPKRSIRFVAFAAEEFGLHGSNYDAGRCVQQATNIRLMINHDMIASNYLPNPQVRLMPYDGSALETQHAMYLMGLCSSIEAILGDSNSRSSDSYSYWRRGYPTLFYFERDFSQVYHSDNDTVANLDPLYCAEVIRGSLATAACFANTPPLINQLIVRDTGDGSSLQISWQAPERGIAGFKIYHAPKDDNPLESEAMFTTQSPYTLSGLQSGIEYRIGVSVIDTEGNESYALYATGSTQLEPREVSGFEAHPDLGGVMLKWKESTELDLAAYEIYRSTDKDEEGELLAACPATATEYLDQSAEADPSVFYYYKIRAIDDSALSSNFSSYQRSRPFSLNCGILILDDSADFEEGSYSQPTDEMVDSFFASLFEPFIANEYDLLASGEALRLDDICIYSSILWHRSVHHWINFRSQLPVLQKYLKYGGRLLFTGYFPYNIFNPETGYPCHFDSGFMRDVLGIAEVDYYGANRFKEAVSLWTDVPNLTLDADKLGSSYDGHIPRIESYLPAQTADVLFEFGSDYEDNTLQGNANGRAVGIANEYYDGRSIVLSFPLYLIDKQLAKDFILEIFANYFGERILGGPDGPYTPAILLSDGYPNPFKDHIRFAVKAKETNDEFSLKVYNLRGQFVRSIPTRPHIREYIWDGKDERGNTLPAGIYFIRAKQAKDHHLIRVVKF